MKKIKTQAILERCLVTSMIGKDMSDVDDGVSRRTPVDGETSGRMGRGDGEMSDVVDGVSRRTHVGGKPSGQSGAEHQVDGEKSGTCDKLSRRITVEGETSGVVNGVSRGTFI